MENAKVLIFEDDDSDFRLASKVLSIGGHEVVHRVNADNQIEAALSAVATGEIQVDLLLVDGNLSRGQDDGGSAKLVIEAARKLEVPLPLVANSSGSMEAYGISGHFSEAVVKGKRSYFSDLSDAVSRI